MSQFVLDRQTKNMILGLPNVIDATSKNGRKLFVKAELATKYLDPSILPLSSLGDYHLNLEESKILYSLLPVIHYLLDPVFTPNEIRGMSNDTLKTYFKDSDGEPLDSLGLIMYTQSDLYRKFLKDLGDFMCIPTKEKVVKNTYSFDSFRDAFNEEFGGSYNVFKRMLSDFGLCITHFSVSKGEPSFVSKSNPDSEDLYEARSYVPNKDGKYEKKVLKGMPRGEFVECASCDSKPDAPTLCKSCLNNRTVIDVLNFYVEKLEKKNKELDKNLEVSCDK